MEIRFATVEDAEAIRKIYEPYVETTAVSFEYKVPTVEEFKNRITNTLKEYPYLVAVEDGVIIAYAYAGSFHTRAAYKHSAELSIYVEKNHRKCGVGRRLYSKLEELLLKQNVYMLHACISSPEVEDEYATKDSEKFHAKMGFELAGRHKKCGYKFGRWYSIVWMDKLIREKDENPEPFVPFPEVKI